MPAVCLEKTGTLLLHVPYIAFTNNSQITF